MVLDGTGPSEAGLPSITRKDTPSMSNLKSIISVVPVTDYAASVEWYKDLIGRDPDVVPDEGVAEWQIADGGWIQIGVNAATAGKTGLVIGVASIDTQISSLSDAGITAGEIQDFGFIKLAEAADPDGNTISFVEEVEGSDA